MFSDDAGKKIRAELQNGARARAEGFEGRARVCARRAAGEAAREYFRLTQGQYNGSAHELLMALQGISGLSPRASEAVAHLLTRVNAEFDLGDGIDLLQEARTLAGELERLNSSCD